MDVAGLITLLGQLGFAAAAYRLASALKERVDNHEVRIAVVENTLSLAVASGSPPEA